MHLFLSLRGYAAGIYTTNSADACYHCLESSRANICVVQDKKQLDKVLSVRSRLKHLKAIVQWEGPVDTSVPGVYSVSIFGAYNLILYNGRLRNVILIHVCKRKDNITR